MYERIALDYDISLFGDEGMIHYNDIYFNLVKHLNYLLDSDAYEGNYSLDYLIENIDIFDLDVRGEILYYLGAVINHSLYFYNISPYGNNIPLGLIKEDIDKYFGSFDNFVSLFKSKASNLKGSGYTFLVMDREWVLSIINTSVEDSPYEYDFIPIMVLDLWEHAYFLDYYSNRDEYIDNYFKIVDFKKIDRLYRRLKKSN